MKKKFLLSALLTICILLSTGCSCDHQWSDATCEKPKTCTKCGETSGDIGGHTRGDWVETADVIHCTIDMKQSCTACDVLLESKTETIETLIEDGMFLPTAQQFLDRMVYVASQDSIELTYEILSSDTAPNATVRYGDYEALIQFFSPLTVTLDPAKTEPGDIWCCSCITIGDTTPELLYYFMIACDPTLDTDKAFDLDVKLVTALANASLSGQSMGYYENNQLLYEIAYIPAGDLGMKESMSMHNIYASSFLE